MKNIKILNRSTPSCPPISAKYCDTFMCRFLGLMRHKSLAANQGLLLVEKGESRINTAIHMLFMKFDIAAIWINEEYQVVDTVLAKRWKISYMPQSPAKFILETHPSRLNDFSIGDQLYFEDV